MRKRRQSTWRKIQVHSAAHSNVAANATYGTHYAQEMSDAWSSDNLWQGKKDPSKYSGFISRRQFIDMPKKPRSISGSFGKQPLSMTQICTIFFLMMSAGLGLGIAVIMLSSSQI